MSHITISETSVIPLPEKASSNWKAWINKMPPPPDTLHVRGEVTVPNPGVDAYLYKKVPQGINPDILLLDLVLVQRPGLWPQIIFTKNVAYEEVGKDLSYSTVSVIAEGTVVADINVDLVF